MVFAAMTSDTPFSKANFIENASTVVAFMHYGSVALTTTLL